MNRIATIFISSILCLLLHAQGGVMKQDMFAGMTQTDKAVVIAVHSGTTDREAQAKSIDPFNARLQKEYANIEFREAWSSRSIVKAYREAGAIIHTPMTLLRELRTLGYTHVLIQPSYLTDGVEMEHLRAEVEQMKKHFKHIRLGEPLLNDMRDYELMVLGTAGSHGEKKTGTVFVFEGERGVTNTSFAMVDYMLRNKELDNMYAVTLDGHPDTEFLKRELKLRKEKKVNIVPCMFPYEAATAQRIATLKAELEDAGQKVTIVPSHIGESQEILDLYTEHTRFAQMYRTLTATEQTLINN